MIRGLESEVSKRAHDLWVWIYKLILKKYSYVEKRYKPDDLVYPPAVAKIRRFVILFALLTMARGDRKISKETILRMKEFYQKMPFIRKLMKTGRFMPTDSD